MSWNGHLVVDMDSHIMERPERMFRDFVDPEYREPYERLSAAVEKQNAAGLGTSLVGTRHAILSPVETGRPLGVRDTFGLTPQRGSGRRVAKGSDVETAGDTEEIPPEVNSDPQARLAAMDRAAIDVSVLFPTHVTSYSALRDVGFETAMYRAYHRWVSTFCSRAPDRLKWTVVCNMRDVEAGVAEVRCWAESDLSLVGIYLSPRAPDGTHLDNPDFHPIYQAAQDLDLPILVHPGTARPPFGPGTFDLDGAWFLIQSLANAWSGMAALGALIGGGVLDLFPRLRAALVETSGAWVPFALERFESNFLTSPGMAPNLTRPPREVLAEGRYFHALDSWEGEIEHCVEALGEDLWLFSTDFPHKGTQWPHGVAQTVERPGLGERARRKILSENALRLCSRIKP